MCSPNDTQTQTHTAAVATRMLHCDNCKCASLVCLLHLNAAPVLALLLVLVVVFLVCMTIFYECMHAMHACVWVCVSQSTPISLWHRATKKCNEKKRRREKKTTRHYYLGMHCMVEGRLYVELGSLSLPLLPFLCVHNDHIERQRRQTNRIQRIKRTFIEKKGLDFFLAFAFYIIAGLELGALCFEFMHFHIFFCSIRYFFLTLDSFRAPFWDIFLLSFFRV